MVTDPTGWTVWRWVSWFASLIISILKTKTFAKCFHWFGGCLMAWSDRLIDWAFPIQCLSLFSHRQRCAQVGHSSINWANLLSQSISVPWLLYALMFLDWLESWIHRSTSCSLLNEQNKCVHLKNIDDRMHRPESYCAPILSEYACWQALRETLCQEARTRKRAYATVAMVATRCDVTLGCGHVHSCNALIHGGVDTSTGHLKVCCCLVRRLADSSFWLHLLWFVSYLNSRQHWHCLNVIQFVVVPLESDWRWWAILFGQIMPSSYHSALSGSDKVGDFVLLSFRTKFNGPIKMLNDSHGKHKGSMFACPLILSLIW